MDKSVQLVVGKRQVRSRLRIAVLDSSKPVKVVADYEDMSQTQSHSARTYLVSSIDNLKMQLAALLVRVRAYLDASATNQDQLSNVNWASVARE